MPSRGFSRAITHCLVLSRGLDSLTVNRIPACCAVITAAACSVVEAQARPSSSDWPAYGHDPGGSHYSADAQITRDNVAQLQPAWLYRTGDYHRQRGRFEANPLVINGLLYVSTPFGTVIALDPASGVEQWRFVPDLDLEGNYGDLANRGVATWRDPLRRVGQPCRRRVFVATVDARLIALDAATGRPCNDFGTDGRVDLAQRLRNRPAYHYEYGVTSPPAVIGNAVIVGSAVADNQRTDAPEGTVRAFDTRTGRVRWSWDPIPPAPGSPGAANAWSVLSTDSVLDLVFVPVGSASPDFYGGERAGDNRHASSVVALRGSTGRLVWSFQVVHHDLWDYDVPAQPTLFTLRRGTRPIPAVAVATKMGHLFILDRRTGEPLFPVSELPVPATDVQGETAWPTQPFPLPPFRLAPESLTPDQAFGVTDSSRAWCRARLAALRYDGVFTPPSRRGTIIWPGNIGGMNWSGVAVDERRGLLIAPTNRLAMVVTLIPRDSLVAARRTHPDEEISSQRGTPYGMMRQVLTLPHGPPCTPPPWGTLVAFDLHAGAVKWEVPLGSVPPLAQLPGAERWGSISLGGATVTAGGLVFIAGTLDPRLRAFDEATGRELWSAPLPAGAHAVPTTYLADGRQYVVIAAGGHDRLGTPMGDYVVAFTLPGPGAPVLDTTDTAVAGEYSGEIRVGAARIGLDLAFQALGDSLTGTIGRIDSVRLTGPVTVRRAGRGVTIEASFDYPAQRCAGRFTATGAPWNRGQLLEGDVLVTGTCGDQGRPEPGSFALWRRKG